jgi:hypothetical protein
MIFNDAIHVQVKKGRENNNVENISISKAIDCLCVVHDVSGVLNLLLLCINDHNQDKEYTDVAFGMDGHLV